MDRPMLFNDEMVRAILEGRKTQTRRVMKVQPPSDRHQLLTVMSSTDRRREGKSHWAILNDERTSVIDGHKQFFACPYGQPGDRLWVRETWATRPIHDDLPPRDIPTGSKLYYPATPELGLLNCEKHRPSIHMPRWASRITLEITGVRVERLQDITAEDAKAEGVEPFQLNGWCDDAKFRGEFCSLWMQISGPDSWDANPWVWVIEFRRVD